MISTRPFLQFTRMALTAAICMSMATARAEVRLPKLVSNGMVLQRDIPTTIWGWADPGESVSVTIKGVTMTSTTNEKGQWNVEWPAQSKGGPYSISIRGENEVVVDDVMFGDVWICSGQSNMEISMGRASPLYPREIAIANHPHIRYFEVPKRHEFNTPQRDLPSGSWEAITIDNILSISAVAYFFAVEIQRQYDVPVGLINTSRGGTPIQAWLSEESIKSFPRYHKTGARFKSQAFIDSVVRSDQARQSAWYEDLNSRDKGHGPTHWSDPHLDDSRWSTMNLPGFWADEPLGDVQGVVWFRTEIDILPEQAGKPARLNLGRIVDSDSAFVNGQFVGTTGYTWPPRRYEVPKGLLKTGKNQITVRIVNVGSRGGLYPDKPFELIVQRDTLQLEGKWKYKLGADAEPLRGQTFIDWQPFALHNSMVHPLFNYRIKGVLWYQGESNAGSPMDYDKLLRMLIDEWRSGWDQGDFPFLIVQLANYLEEKAEPGQSGWAELRDAQLAALDVPNTRLAVTIDIGDWNDVHPLNKKDVGHRLALAARNVAYGESQLVHSGPIYKSHAVIGDTVVISFDHVGGGLVSSDGQPLRSFSIAGDDHQFKWANAEIRADKIHVWHESVSAPRAVRYAWADNPGKVNFYNLEGLPASPFRTDGREH